MNNVQLLFKNWDRPAKQAERGQLTLRIPISDYLRLLALKEIYPGMSLNDMSSDLLELALDNVVSGLSGGRYTESDIQNMLREDNYSGEEVGERYGQVSSYYAALEKVTLDHYRASKEVATS